MTNKQPVIANKIRCICCQQEVASYLGRHHFNQAKKCRNGSFVDGGAEYGRMGGRDISLIETWNNNLQCWNESNNQLAKDLFRDGKYDYPSYSKNCDFMEYQKKKDAAEQSLKAALFARFGLKGREPGSQDYNNQAEMLWYHVWNMTLTDIRDPDPRDVYFYFIHFVNVVKPGAVRETYMPKAEVKYPINMSITKLLSEYFQHNHPNSEVGVAVYSYGNIGSPAYSPSGGLQDGIQIWVFSTWEDYRQGRDAIDSAVKPGQDRIAFYGRDFQPHDTWRYPDR